VTHQAFHVSLLASHARLLRRDIPAVTLDAVLNVEV